MAYIYKNGRKFGGNVRIGTDEYEELYLDIPEYQTESTSDKEIYDAVSSLGWSGVITNTTLSIKKAFAKILNFISFGGTIFGSLTLKTSSPMVNNTSTVIDLSQSNNGVSSMYYPGFQVLDKSNRIVARMESVTNSNGSNGFNLYARNYDTSGTQTLQGGIAGYIAKDATTMTYNVTTPANFRSAIGAAASSDRRLKSDIVPLGKDAVQFIKDMKPCVYTINGEKQIGFIAQDVHEADKWNTKMAFETQEGIDGLDDWEIMPDGSPTWKLDYIRIIPALTAALQDAMARIDELETALKEKE